MISLMFSAMINEHFIFSICSALVLTYHTLGTYLFKCRNKTYLWEFLYLILLPRPKHDYNNYVCFAWNSYKCLKYDFPEQHNSCLFEKKNAITTLFDKGGNINDMADWRSISICPVVRRVYENILNKCSKEHNIIQHYCIQRFH